MSERKVLNKYYPPDFDPSKIPRMKLPKNRQYTVRLMAPFNMRCATCGEYIYKGKKFNARKEDVENEDYLGIRIYRFYIKCTRCLQEISFKTDPRNTDYEIEAGATRNFMALKLAEEQAQREVEEEKEEEQNNPMKLLENRTKQSKNEIDLLESLEELKDLNKRQQAVDYDTMLIQFDSKLSAKEKEEKLKQMDEEFIKSVKFETNQKRKLVVEEEIIELDDEEESSSEPKKSKLSNRDESKAEEAKVSSASVQENKTEIKQASVPLIKKNTTSWNKSIGTLSRPGKLKNLVKVAKKSEKTDEIISNNVTSSDGGCSSIKNGGLSLVGDYSDSDSLSDS